MKKVILTLSFLLMVILGYSQVTNVGDFRIANDDTQFGANLPIGTKVYNIADGKYYVVKTGLASTQKLAGAITAGSVALLNSTDDQTAAEVSVTASGNLSSDNVQNALQELQGDIDATTSSITTNTAAIAANTTSITANTDAISINTTNISTNTSNIATNTAAITANTSSITTNTSDIATLKAIAKTITTSYEIEATPVYTHALAGLDASQGCVVSINGSVIEPDKYTLASGSIEINSTKVPLYQYDKIVVTYKTAM